MKETDGDVEVSLKGNPEAPIKPNYKKDIKSILLLFLLYILQGIPLGLMLTVPFLLLSRGVSYTEQAKFSLAFWPFSLKVLYAPIIDAVYFKRIGRRKSWLIPLQYLIAIFLFTLSYTVEDLLSARNVNALAVMFFALNFLAASQDVAVDGWALTMLSPENVGYASTCNAAGQTLGFVMGYSVFMALDSSSFANKFRSQPLDVGLVTLPQFLLFWAIVFAITTTLVLIYKKEEKESAQVSEKFHMNIFESYKNLWKILKLRNIQILIVFLLTARIAFAGTDGLTKLKLVEIGVAKETIAFFSIPLIPFKLLIPILIAKWTTGPKPMKVYLNTLPLTLCFGIIFPLVYYWTPRFQDVETGTYDFWYYVFLFGVCALELIPGYTRFVASMAFAAKISDPAIGGTYMTLINTVNNIGGTWPSTVALWLVDYLTFTIGPICGPGNSTEIAYEINDDGNITMTNQSSVLYLYHTRNVTTGENLQLNRKYTVEDCQIKIDGYYIICSACLCFGIIWFVWGRFIIQRLSKRPASTWRVYKNQ